MTAAAISLSEDLEQSNLVMPAISDAASVGALALVDIVGRGANAAEDLIDTVASVTKVVLPATTRIVGAFLPVPEVMNRAIEKGVGVVTSVGATVVSIGAKCALQSVTFGAPAWSQSARQGLAVARTCQELLPDESAPELLARSVATLSTEPLIQNALVDYVNLRGEERRLNRGDSASPVREAEILQAITALEKRLDGYPEYHEIRNALDNPRQFVEQSPRRVDGLAIDLADRILDKIESFYQERLGCLAGSVSGVWSNQPSSDEETAARTEARNGIARRILRILRQELREADREREVEAVKNKLHELFGTYHALAKGAFGVIGGVLASRMESDEVAPKSNGPAGSGGGLPECAFFLEDLGQRIRDGFEGVETTVSKWIGLTGGPEPFQSNTMEAVDSIGHVMEMENCTSGAPPIPRWGEGEQWGEPNEYLGTDWDARSETILKARRDLSGETLPAVPGARALIEEALDKS